MLALLAIRSETGSIKTLLPAFLSQPADGAGTATGAATGSRNRAEGAGTGPAGADYGAVPCPHRDHQGCRQEARIAPTVGARPVFRTRIGQGGDQSLVMFFRAP